MHKSAALTAAVALLTALPALADTITVPAGSVLTLENDLLIQGKTVAGSVTVKVNPVSAPPAISTRMGPLKRSSDNSNYFARPDGTPVILVGSHTWNNFQDEGSTFPPGAFDYTGYLNWMQRNNFNFMRLWNIAEQPYSAPWAAVWYIDPQPYARTGPGNAADGKPKFDLNKFNQAYFDRLRARVIEAGTHGIYVDVMLFEGWSVGPVTNSTNPWTHHPFASANNVNGINGDPSNTGNGYTIQTTSNPVAVLQAQQAYVRKVIDTVGDLDNVLFEVSNESQPTSTQWQYNMINYIKNYEAGKPNLHPVGMTANTAGDAVLFNSPADWISPNYGDTYRSNPPANDGSKVILSDTDHLWGAGGSADWAWQSFTRGLNPIFMDDLGQTGVNLGGRTAFFDPALYTTRSGMAQISSHAAKLDLKKAKPHGELTSTTYALANPCAQYLVYGGGGGFTVNLSACSGISFDASWTDMSGKAYSAAAVTGGAVQSLTPPFSGPSVLLLNGGSAQVLSADGAVLENGATGSLVTTRGTWTFGNLISPGVWHLLLNGAQVGFGTSKLQVCFGGQLCARGYDGTTWWTVTGVSQWAASEDPTVTLTADGTVLENGATGKLVTTRGTWTFGNLISPGVWHLLLNGTQVGFGTSRLQVCFGGQLCARGYDGTTWWTVTGVSQWAASEDPTVTLTADGTVLENGATGNLVTTRGKWTFGNLISPGVWHLLLNGTQVGFGTSRIQVCFGGQLCARGYDGHTWWTVTGVNQWAASTDPNGISVPTDNVMSVTNKSGAVVQNYPLPFGRPFICGEIAHYPQVLVNGTAIQTQADVKNRCADGSVKFAVISAVLPSLPVGTSLNVTFQDQPSGNNAPIATADLLTQFPDFDATIELTKPSTITGTYEPDYSKWQSVTNGSLSFTVDGTSYNITGINLSTLPNVSYASIYAILPAVKAAKVPITLAFSPTQTFAAGGRTLSLRVPATGQDIGPLLFKSGVSTAGPSAPVSVSARKMLTDGNCKPWTSGPVAQTMICADRSAARAYDLDPTGNGWKPAHPEFVATFWPGTRQVFVRSVGEVTNTMAQEAFTADVKLTAGKASPTVVHQQAAVPHSLATRWTKTIWLGSTPESKVNIDHNIGYLADTKYLPNFDRSLKIPESVLADAYSNWQSLPRTKIGDAGEWMLDMPATGYHPDIGPMPVWYNRAVYSGDYRMREIMLGQADLVGAFGMQTREGDPARFADRAHTVPAIGRPLTVYARPNSPYAPDQLTIHSPVHVSGYTNDIYANSDWTTDGAHQPDPFTVPYMWTGDPYYLDGLYFWEGTGSFSSTVGCDGAGRCGPYAVIMEQVRGQAWLLRTRTNAWLMAPDNDPMKAIFSDMLDDALATWEGERAITGTKYQNTFMWQERKPYIGNQDHWLNLGPSPLHWWEYQDYSVADTNFYNPAVAGGANSMWQQSFVILAMCRAVEVGFDGAKPLCEWAAKNGIDQMTDPDYNPHLGLNYNTLSRKIGPAHFTSWREVMTGWSNSYKSTTDMGYWPAIGTEIYWDVLHGAIGVAASVGVPNADLALTRFGNVIAAKITETGQTPNWNFDPTWAIVPRAAH